MVNRADIAYTVETSSANKSRKGILVVYTHVSIYIYTDNVEFVIGWDKQAWGLLL